MGADKLTIGVASTVAPKLCGKEPGDVLRPAKHYCRIAERAFHLGAHTVLFSPPDFHGSGRYVVGWIPIRAREPFGAWQRTEHDLPDAVYENVFVHLAVGGYASAMRRSAKLRGIPVFNPPLPNKWRLTQLLQHTDCAAFLPATDKLGSLDTAVRRIRRWGTAYVKPVGGYGGIGVTRVEAQAQDRFRVSTDRTASRVAVRRRTVDETGLRQLLRRRSLVPHLLQQGIPLMTVNNRKLDFRVVCQRDGTGQWRTVGIVPKQAAPDGVVTNIIAGGERLTLTACERLAQQEGKTIPSDLLASAAEKIGRAIGLRNGHAGLVGFDMGVDDSGQVWMIEMNPKPARSLLDDDQRKRSAHLAAEWAVHLARRR